jgi:hypothetical protein
VSAAAVVVVVAVVAFVVVVVAADGEVTIFDVTMIARARIVVDVMT